MKADRFYGILFKFILDFWRIISYNENRNLISWTNFLNLEE